MTNKLLRSGNLEWPKIVKLKSCKIPTPSAKNWTSTFDYPLVNRHNYWTWPLSSLIYPLNLVDFSIKKLWFSIKKHGGFFQFAFHVSQRDPLRQYVIHGGRITIPQRRMLAVGQWQTLWMAWIFHTRSHWISPLKFNHQPSTHDLGASALHQFCRNC